MTPYVGIFLFFRAVTSQVSSALLSLTSVFGMGTGGPSASSIPTFVCGFCHFYVKVLLHCNNRFQYIYNIFKSPALYACFLFFLFGDSCGNRTRVIGVRGRCLNRLTNEPFSFLGGLEVRGVFLLTLTSVPFWCTIRGSNPGHPD